MPRQLLRSPRSPDSSTRSKSSSNRRHSKKPSPSPRHAPTGGLRVQATSPSLGAASVRIQGMRGRYTRFLSDGLPLFGEVGGLGLLQIPPMDLAQVEGIKSVASSLYGAGAMGGVVNLISRRPGPEAQRELLVNRATRGGTDAIAWYSTHARQPGWAFTMI